MRGLLNSALHNFLILVTFRIPFMEVLLNLELLCFYSYPQMRCTFFNVLICIFTSCKFG
uniref:Uncharacterized protein n=1 Tax=Arundo donax TaxID=35708 RepID=A0A0A9F3R2_ARUDO